MRRVLLLLTFASIAVSLFGCGTAKHEHSWSEWETVSEATCGVEGEQKRTCECGETETQKIPATGNHSYESKVTQESTCTQEGVEVFTCKVCGNSYTKPIAKLDHHYNLGKEIKKPTCSEEGTEEFTCAWCGETKQEPIPATGRHTYTSVETKKSTCVEEGIKTFTCSQCGQSYTEPIPVGEHTYSSKETKKATCTQDGEKKYTCSVCGKSYTEKIKATGHSYSEKITKKATCTENGERTYTCKCGDTYKETIKATGHDWKSATCTEPKTCSKCKATEGKALGHTCQIGTCSRCKKKVATIDIPQKPVEMSNSFVSVKVDKITYSIESSYLHIKALVSNTWCKEGSCYITFDYIFYDKDGVQVCSWSSSETIGTGESAWVECNVPLERIKDATRMTVRHLNFGD